MSGTTGCLDCGPQASSYFESENCKLARTAFAEFIGTGIFIFCGLASCLNWTHEADHDQLIRIGLTFGFALTGVIYIFGKVSGAHVNPAVTLAFIIAGRTKLLQGFLYIVAQILGGITGAGLLYLIQTEDYTGSKTHLFGLTKINPDLGAPQGLFSETITTAILILAALILTDSTWSVEYSSVTPIALGLILAVLEFGFVNATGGSMNPARSTGPACIVGDFGELWVYWLGPTLGAIVAVLIYTVITYQPKLLILPDGTALAIDWGNGDPLTSNIGSTTGVSYDAIGSNNNTLVFQSPGVGSAMTNRGNPGIPIYVKQ